MEVATDECIFQSEIWTISQTMEAVDAVSFTV